MAIVAYTGVMGSGKTYEAVSTAALNALRSGRRVVTNISGFNFEAVRDHLGPFKDGSILEPDKVVVIHSDRITKPHFFYDPDVLAESVVRPGDLVLIDEVWAFWGTDNKLTPEHQKFFRMHRHYTELGSGTSCDMVIMIQDLTSLHRFVRGVLESSFKFTKLKSIGLSSKYRFEVYEGRRQTRSSLVTASVKSYDKKIFPLYKSYDGDKGREQVVDDRQNLFKNKWFVASMAIALAGLLFASWWFVGWISKMRSGGTENHPQGIQPANVSSQQPSSPIGTSNRSLSEVGRLPDLSADARLVAVLEPSKGEVVVVLQSSDGRYIRQRMNAGVVDGWQSVAGYQGRMVGFVFGGKSK